MQITDIRLRKVAGEGKLKAYVTITFDKCFVVHNLKVIEGKEGMFIAMPSRMTEGVGYKDIAHPITPEFRAELSRQILDKYGVGPGEEKPAESASSDSPSVEVTDEEPVAL